MKQRSRGVSLVEALVATTVMAFGLLGIVGMQSTMRFNSDLAKQRSEAVRIAHEAMEEARAYGALTGVGSYDAIASATTTVTLPAGNATYALTTTVQTTSASPPLKRVRTAVQWSDRGGNTQGVTLSSGIAGVAPELGGALAAPKAGGPARRVHQQHPGIPTAAVDLGSGRSGFVPPGGAFGWVFDNATGLIVQECATDFVSSCTPVDKLLVTGFVRFATTATTEQAELPLGTAFAVEVRAVLTEPTATTVACYVTAPTSGPGSFVAYYCALPVTVSIPARWSGTTLVSSTVVDLATSTADAAATRFRVCRYTPRDQTGAAAHPATYSNVTASLSNQNFLVIPAGDGAVALSCPGEDTGGTSPYIDGTTANHQP